MATGSAEGANGTKSVLVVEDNELVRRIYINCIEELGFDAIETERPEQALDLMREYAPDLVIMDIMMPGMSGLELIGLIRADASLAQTPVVAVTTLADETGGPRFLEAGFDAYLGKPISLDALARLIGRFVH